MITRLKTSEILPVSLSEIKVHLRLDHAHEDEYLRSLILAAVGVLEEYLGRSLLTQTWRLIWENSKSHLDLLSGSQGAFCIVPLPYPPLCEIVAVHRLTEGNKKAPIRRHRLDLNHQIPRLIFADVCEPVEIDFVAGYGNRPTDIPALIRQALILTVADFYEHRDSGSFPQSDVIRHLLDTYRIVRLA